MQDLERVRSALGYQSINLYGVSYGTRAALTYLKMYPEQVRSVVLDAVVDPAFVLYQDASQDGQKALNLFFSRCEEDEACASTYPNLKAELDSVLQDLDAAPSEITIPHPVTGKPLELTVTRTIFTNMIFNTLYSPDLVALLPLSIHQAYAEKNYAPLIAQAYLMDAGLYDGMFYAVTCTEDAPLISPDEAKQDGAESIFGDRTLDFIEVCETWPKGDAPAILRAPVTSDIPVLLLSGQADPITPPWHADHLAKSLPNSLHLIFEGMGHGNATNDCVTRILDQFMDSAAVKDLDTSCLKTVAPPPFFVDFSGPQP
jgi:pimeloyl-ACP methyl ester carboxylesterase